MRSLRLRVPRRLIHLVLVFLLLASLAGPLSPQAAGQTEAPGQPLGGSQVAPERQAPAGYREAKEEATAPSQPPASLMAMVGSAQTPGSPWGWGLNMNGQVGDGSSGSGTNKTAPVPVSGLTGLKAVAGGGSHSLGLRSDGTVWGWGYNYYGQLGVGNRVSYATPQQTNSLSGITAIAAGRNFSLAINGSGTMWGWGINTRGQLGFSSSPIPWEVNPRQVTALSNVAAIAAGGEHSLAVKSDGSAWATGYNAYGQLGDGTTSNSASHIQVSGLSGVSDVAAGGDHSLALKSDGSVWAWGRNDRGQLGVGDTTNHITATFVLSDVQAIAAGLNHSLAIKTDGTLLAWGDNYFRQLGVNAPDNCGGYTCAKTPITVTGLSNVAAITGGYGHSLAAQTDGELWGWGSNSYGQVGVGNTTLQSVPVLVTKLTGTMAIEAGDHHSLATAMSEQAAPATTEHSQPVLNALPTRDPVHTFTGSFMYAHTDLAIAGRGPSPLFARAYNSNDTRVGPLGPGWTHSYDVRLRGDGSGGLTLVGPQGRSDAYTLNADGSYSPPAGVYTALVRNADGTFTATHKDRTTWTFNGQGNLTAIADRHGNQSALTYNTSGRLVAVSDPAGRGSLALTYDTSTGRLTSVSDWLSPARSVQFGYDASGRLSTVTDREGQTTTFGYDGTSHRLTTISDARGNVAVTNTYDAQGRVSTQKDARGLATGQQTVLDYTTITATTVVTYPATSLDPTWSFREEDTYDSEGRITKRVSKPVAGGAEDATVEYAYDSASNLSALTDARGKTTSFCYDVDYAGAAIAGSKGNLTRRIDPPPAAGADRPVTLYKYDAKDNLIQAVPPRGVPSSPTVTCSTNLSSTVDLRYATDFNYDVATQTRLEATSRAYSDPDSGSVLTATTKLEYGDAANPGLVTRLIPPRGNSGATPDYSYAITNTYGTSGIQAGMLLTVTDALGNATGYGYDAVGRRTSMVDPSGNAAGGTPAEHTWEYVYDKEDRLRFSKAPAPQSGGSQLVSEYRYDSVGNRTVVIDANGQVTKYGYDERDGLAYVFESPDVWTDPTITPTVVITTAYQYDDADNLDRVVRAKGDTTYERAVDYAYDGLNRLRKEIQYPSWPVTTTTLLTEYTYDGNGNRLTLRDPLSQTTSFGYDALNRLTSVTYDDGTTPNVTYTYDIEGNRTSMADGTGTTTYSYDEVGRPITVTNPLTKTVGYRYDLDGNRTKLIYPDGTAVTYSFDKAGRLDSLLDWASRSTSYQYLPDGSLKSVANPNGTSAEYSYDNALRLKDVWNKQSTNTISRHSYTLDAAGNRTQLDEQLPQLGAPGQTITSTSTYDYDKLYRLTSAATDAITTTYGYDPVGNRLSLSREVTATYAYDGADRIQQAGAVTYTVNANGNLVSRGADTFGYDQANRLITATVGVTTTVYAYNGDGVRAGKTVSGTTTSYVYDLNRSLPVVLDDGDRKYVWGLGLAYSVDVTGTVAVYHVDGLGSVQAMSNSSAEVVQTYQTDEFGVPTQTQGSVNQPFQYTGEQRDGESGFVYLRARMYDPKVGRFLSKDPLAKSGPGAQGWNRYAYARNNPVNELDPSGYKSIALGQLFSNPGSAIWSFVVSIAQRAGQFAGGIFHRAPASVPTSSAIRFTSQTLGGNLIRTAEFAGTQFRFNTGHAFYRAHRISGTDLRTTGLTPDAVEGAIATEVLAYQAAGGILPQTTQTGHGVLALTRTVTVDGFRIVFTAVQHQAAIIINDYRLLP